MRGDLVINCAHCGTRLLLDTGVDDSQPLSEPQKRLLAELTECPSCDASLVGVPGRAVVQEPMWNGEPCNAVRVNLMLTGDGGHQGYWAEEFIGTVRKAVAVTYNGATFYLEDEHGDGSRKVFEAGGMPGVSHANLYGSIVEERQPPRLVEPYES